MNGSSELSDALNPNYFSYERQATSHHNAAVQSPPAPAANSYHGSSESSHSVTTAAPYSHHRSELENAVNPRNVNPHIRPAAPEQTPADPLRLLTTLMKSLTSYKDAVETERRRRVAWEKAQEAKCLERHKELQSRLDAMQQEISSLKANVDELQASTTAAMDTDPQQIGGPCNDDERNIYAFGSSRTLGQPDSEQMSTSARKRPRSATPSEDGETSKMGSHPENRLQTIHSVMRSHILSSMALHTDEMLPPFEEGPDSDPVRFVWNQTTKKSAHNARMKSRIISDLLSKRNEYPQIPEKDFSKGKLENVFEQAFTTLRQKYAAQFDGGGSARAREEKSRRSRRMSRKKIKHGNRVATREKHNEFSHNVFDAAFQIECISSEESGEDESARGLHLDDDGHEKNKVLFIRYLAWRSTRLHRLYEMVDQYEEDDRKTKQRRGVGRLPRQVAGPKAGNPLPPAGTPRWMVSKRWFRDAVAANFKLGEVLNEIIKPDDGEEAWRVVNSVLGAESDDEQPQQLPVYHDVQMQHGQVEEYQDHYYMHQHLPQTAWTGDMGGYVDYNQNGQHYPPVIN